MFEFTCHNTVCPLDSALSFHWFIVWIVAQVKQVGNQRKYQNKLYVQWCHCSLLGLSKHVEYALKYIFCKLKLSEFKNWENILCLLFLDSATLLPYHFRQFIETVTACCLLTQSAPRTDSYNLEFSKFCIYQYCFHLPTCCERVKIVNTVI